MFTNPKAKKDKVSRARFCNNVLEPGCKKSGAGINSADRNRPKTNKRLLAQEKLCNEHEGPMCKGSDTGSKASDLATSAADGLNPGRAWLWSKRGDPSDKESGTSTAMPRRTKLCIGTAGPERAKSGTNGERPRRTWLQARNAEPMRAKLCTAVCASGHAPPKGEEVEPNRVMLRTKNVDSR